MTRPFELINPNDGLNRNASAHLNTKGVEKKVLIASLGENVNRCKGIQTPDDTL